MCNETQRFKIGQKVKIINTTGTRSRHQSKIGTIIGTDDLSCGMYFLIQFDAGGQERFNKSNIEPLIEQPDSNVEFKLGQQVKILNGCGGAKPYIGQTGVIHEFEPIGVKFNDGKVWYFNDNDIELPIEQPAPNVRPKVGQKLLVVSSFDGERKYRIGQVGTLIKDDKSGVPFKLEFRDGEYGWFKQTDVTWPTKQNYVFSILKPGMRVKSSRNGWLIVVPSTMVNQDSDCDLMLWATGGCCSEREHILDELKHVEAVYQTPSDPSDAFAPSKHGDRVWEVSQWVDPEEAEKQQKREYIMKQIQDLRNQLLQIK